jgi:hypothetical protein
MQCCSQDRIYLIKNDKRVLKREPEVPTFKIELPKKKEIPKKTKNPGSPSSSSNYAYGFDQLISSSPNTAFFIHSLKTRLNKY